MTEPDTPTATDAVCELAPAAGQAVQGLTPTADDGPRADCVLCGEPTEYPADHAGRTLCAVCTWQQAQRIACAG
ncbi:hypothetical protein [Kitasatospora sp. DSM 101779]|uniref:hypothetical protein n=1 Tax=Kitasatospora sp. DSM 101779 TaxID=2853165 RepID=UPI0021DA9C62|nr:hypothetical protein [Kitasatospora sp. DSM 101779]MCU7821838.1 hypothetical protein [Kitasatospora sp. DSM 101779]